MLPGFNHNIKYRDKIFHVQTEDNGEDNPLIISHIFVGGNIIATKKTDYSNLLGKEDIASELKVIMENQHKELIKDLITGKFDSHPIVSGAEILSENKEQKEDIKTTTDPINIPKRDVQPEASRSHFKPVSSNSNFTVFGEETITEETLDKVILRFLKENK